MDKKWMPWLVLLSLCQGLAPSLCQGLAPSTFTRETFLEPDFLQPYILVLGTAQDGGIPQVGCQRNCCKEAMENPSKRKYVSSLLIVDPATRKRWLIDATPDIREQVSLAKDHPKGRPINPGRPPLFEGIFLTHAHMGHYSGLLHLGREAYGHPEIPLFGTPRMLNFLRENGPWNLLFKAKHLKAEEIAPGKSITLSKALTITPFLVPHREEFSDTVGYLIQGSQKKLLYIPDIDKWAKWGKDIRVEISSVDYALLDGTFYADGEIPGRAIAEIPHPFISESLSLFSELDLTERNKIFFIHFNHTNPAVDPQSPAASAIKKGGMHCTAEGQIFNL